MTVITVSATDGGVVGTRWEVPQDQILNMSPIPRGLRLYQGNQAIAALGANDETSVVITLTFPTAFQYLPKSLGIMFQSDDTTTEFQDIGTMEYRPGANQSLGIRMNFALFSDGAGIRLGIQSIQNYRPEGTWRRWINGPDGDTLVLMIADISNDTSTAGDIAWVGEFWEYDIEQCLKWPVNTPAPTLTY